MVGFRLIRTRVYLGVRVLAGYGYSSEQNLRHGKREEKREIKRENE